VDTLDLSTTTHSNVISLVAGSYSTINHRPLDTQIAFYQQQYRDQGVNGDSFVRDTLTSYSNQLYTGENALGIAYGVVIENATGGSAADRFYDNGVDNVLRGGAGDDLFYLGAGGFDTLYGDEGTDKLMLEGMSKASVQLEKQATGATILVADGFAATLIGIEGIQFSDQYWTVV